METEMEMEMETEMETETENGRVLASRDLARARLPREILQDLTLLRSKSS